MPEISRQQKLLLVWLASFAVRLTTFFLVVPLDRWEELVETDEVNHAYFIDGVLHGEFTYFQTPQGSVNYSPITALVLLLPFLLFRAVGFGLVASSALAGVLLSSLWPVVVFLIAEHLKTSTTTATALSIFSPLDIADTLTWGGFSLELTILCVSLFILFSLREQYALAAIAVLPSLLAHRTGLLLHLTAIGISIISVFFIKRYHHSYHLRESADTSRTHEIPLNETIDNQSSIRRFFAVQAGDKGWIVYQIPVIIVGIAMTPFLISSKVAQALDTIDFELGSLFSPFWLLRFTGFVFLPLCLAGLFLFCKDKSQSFLNALALVVYPLTSVSFMLLPVFPDASINMRFISASAAPLALLATFALERLEKRTPKHGRWITAFLIAFIAVFSVCMGISRTRDWRIP